MTSLVPPKGTAAVDRLLSGYSIRAKLGVGFGVLLALGLINLAIQYWGAYERARAFSELQRAVDRQMRTAEVLNRLQDQKKYIDVLTGVVGVQRTAAPSAEERRRFGEGLDAIVALFHTVVEEADSGGAATIRSMYDKTVALTDSWKRFYEYQGTDPSRAIEELYARAEPLSVALLTEELPAQVRREQQQLVSVQANFISMDRLYQRVAWGGFILSVLLGGLLAVLVSRDVLRSVSALKSGAERVGEGALAHRIPVRSQDELGEVAEAFNDMAERLDQRTAELAFKRHEVERQRDELQTTLVHLKDTQAQLIQQEKLASLGALTAGIAHEIKNPLNFVNNFAQLSSELLEELEDARRAEPDRPISAFDEDLEDLKLNARKVVEHGKRADSIVRSMLEHSRGGKSERKAADVNALVEEYVGLAFHGMRAQKADFNATIERDYDAEAGQVEVTPQEIGRVLLNLLGNAFYAVHQRALAEQKTFAPTVKISTQRVEDSVEIRIWDNGGGIPADVQARIFEPFFTTKPTGEGTGLGLSLSYDIITQGHGGALAFESHEGECTEFMVTLPLVSEPYAAEIPARDRG